jgi:hypothetical protein
MATPVRLPALSGRRRTMAAKKATKKLRKSKKLAATKPLGKVGHHDF